MKLETIIKKAIILSSALSLTAFSEKAEAQHVKIANVGAYSVPVLHDADNDGNLDLFIGKQDGTISFFRNTGTETSPQFALETENYSDIDIEEHAAPCFCDINNDGKAELFIGNRKGNLFSYENVGTLETPEWKETTIFQNMGLGSWNKPVFYDIDNDEDKDLFVGGYWGNINYFENIGTKTVPEFTLGTETFQDIDVGSKAAPYFCDFNNDGKADLLLGRGDGKISWYEFNTENSLWEKVTDSYNLIDVGESSTLALEDINNNSRLDGFIGAKNGDILLYNDFAKILLYIKRRSKNNNKLMFESRAGENNVLEESTDLKYWTELETIISEGYNERILPSTDKIKFYRILCR